MAQKIKNEETSKSSKFWEKNEDKIMAILVPIFTIICDAIVVYSIIYCIMMHFPWYWIALIILITFPVLYFFNKYGFDGLKKMFKKKKE